MMTSIRRLTEILAFITNIEHAGDIIESNLMAIAAERLKRGLAFSVEGQAEIRAMLDRLDKQAAVMFAETPTCVCRPSPIKRPETIVA
jgi:Na+/phosphate symporter